MTTATPTRTTMPSATTPLVGGLNFGLNREVTTFLRYIQQAAMLKGVQWEPLRQVYLDEVLDEMRHAQYLANKIVMLGGAPHLEPDLTPPPTDPRQMLQNDIDEERVDVKSYKELARQANEEGLIELKLQMEEQAADEARHAEQMLRLLG